jgi:hypothetical protein
MSEGRVGPQTWEHIEKKGLKKPFFTRQTWEHTEKKASYKNLWKLESGMTTCRSGETAPGVHWA